MPVPNTKKKILRLIGRNSKLSLIQLDIAKQKIETTFSDIEVEIIARTSKGDSLPNIPLHTVEGSDFFTQEIFDALQKGEADIAIHSLKDMSAEHFLGSNTFAVIDRDDTRDVAIFNENIITKILQGEPIIIGTCSPRREQMATDFLKKALPQLHDKITIITKPIRGNVETRLQKLNTAEYDVTILATAGINRLLKNNQYQKLISDLLSNKKLMLLPLIECVPAPCQGAIVAEAFHTNTFAINIVSKINNEHLFADCYTEKTIAKKYGTGCLQKFGVTTISLNGDNYTYAAGIDENNNLFEQWHNLPKYDFKNKTFFSTVNFMGNFFNYEYYINVSTIKEDVVYIANYKAIQQVDISNQLLNKNVWAAGTKTWLELAKKGIWVTGSADAFGLDSLEKIWQMPLINCSKNKVAVITNNQSAITWKNKGWITYGTYTTTTKNDDVIAQRIKHADVIFWTSIRQYEQCKNYLKPSVIHICPYGETTEQFKALGIKPIVFPNIKAFKQWSTINI